MILSRSSLWMSSISGESSGFRASSWPTELDRSIIIRYTSMMMLRPVHTKATCGSMLATGESSCRVVDKAFSILSRTSFRFGESICDFNSSIVCPISRCEWSSSTTNPCFFSSGMTFSLYLRRIFLSFDRSWHAFFKRLDAESRSEAGVF